MDCERIVSGMLGQPANALSSLAFLGSAAWILVLALRGERAARFATIVFAAAVAANALGSFALHGPDPSWAKWVHDLAILSVLLFIGIHALGRMLGWRTVVLTAAYAVGILLLGLGVAALRGGSSDPLAGGLALGAIGGELAVLPLDPPVRRPRGRNAVRVAGLATLALGGLAFLLGRTGSPLCRPESLFQWHAVWHVLAASALVAYAYVALYRPSSRT